MRALDRKLVRDVWRLRGQVVAIAFVVASGVALLLMSLSSIEALQETADAYYERYRFADVFASVKRAPETLTERIAELPGVQAVSTGVVKWAVLDIEGFAEPVIGELVSIPEEEEPVLNRLAVRAGRLAAKGRPDEAVLSERFAEAHGLEPGDQIQAILNGRKRTLDIVGIALSPEYVYTIGPGALVPDDTRYGIIWMGREALDAAFDLDGAFNSVSLSLLRGASPEATIQRLDRLLDRYGGVGAFARADQISHWFLANEIEQLKTTARILPAIFLGVAAFLTNMVLARLIATERSEIGLMKAFGYSHLEIGWHYAKMVILITSVGIVIGWLLGAWLGRFNTQIYAEVLFHFPFLLYRPGPQVFVITALVSLAAALLGSLGSVLRAARLPPAEAMSPPAPPLYRKSRLGGAGAARWLDQPTRIVLRQIARWPVRSFFTAAGIATAVAVLITAFHWLDSINHMVDVYFFQGQRQHLTVGLVEAQSSEVERDFGKMPGVLATEPGRTVTTIFRHGRRTHRGAITGLPPDAYLSPIFDAEGHDVPVPPRGLAMSTQLAKKLGISRGDNVQIKILQGRRPTRDVPVVHLFETYIGMPAHMNLDALNRIMREPPSVEFIHLLRDPADEASLFAELKDLPDVAAVILRSAAVDTFYETMGKTLTIFVSFFIAFAGALAVGVVYNSARIALSERGRELATLRVLGFSRTDISYILLGEVALLTLVALPLGCLGGWSLAWVIVASFETELYRLPMVIEPSTYGWATAIVLAATIVSAALVRRRIDRLDLIAVLKTRE
ncbi:MAG: ABC transporter permease [Minwuiales bacterium]|nr:ABC transporter permease [Minwuiales bacterium]